MAVTKGKGKGGGEREKGKKFGSEIKRRIARRECACKSEREKEREPKARRTEYSKRCAIHFLRKVVFIAGTLLVKLSQLLKKILIYINIYQTFLTAIASN